MKKVVLTIFLFIFLILSLQLASAVTINMKSQYLPGETLIAEIQGSFISSLGSSNVYFYSGKTFVPMLYDIGKVGSSYYVYAVLPNEKRNYTLVLKNIKYFQDGEEKSDDISKDFLVKGNISSFFVNPGFVITDKNFYVELTSNKQQKVKITFLNLTQEYNLIEGQTKRPEFSVSSIKNFTTTKVIIESSDLKYEVPVAIFGKDEINETPQINYDVLKFSSNFTNIYAEKNSQVIKKTYLMNTGQKDIKNITLTVSSILEDIVLVTPITIENLKAGNWQEINLSTSSSKNISGLLKARAENYSTNMMLNVLIIKNISKINTSEQDIQSCSFLKGKICIAGKEVCNGNSQLASDGICCAGTCKSTAPTSKKSLIIILLIIGILVLLYLIYKKSNFKKKTSNEVIEKSTEDYESRFKLQQTKGKLGKS